MGTMKKKCVCIILLLSLVTGMLGNSNFSVAASKINLETDTMLIDAVNKYTSAKFNSSDIDKIKKSSLSDNEKYLAIKKIYDNAKNSYNERWSYEGLINSDMYVAYQFKEYLNNDKKARTALNLSALVFNDDISDIAMGNNPEKKKYKEMLKDYMNSSQDYFLYITYVNEILDTINTVLKETEDSVKVDELTKLYCSIENAKNRKQIEELIFKSLDKAPIFYKLEDGKYVFRSNLPKVLGLVGDTVSFCSDTAQGIKNIYDSVALVKSYELYQEFLNTICNYKDGKTGNYKMPYSMRCAANELKIEMQSNFNAVIGSLLPLFQDYYKFGMDKVVDVLSITTKGLISGISAGFSIGKLIGNIVLGMDEIINSAAYVEGYAYLGDLYTTIIKEDKNEFVKNKSIVNAKQFQYDYDILWSIRQKGEQTYLDMVSFKKAWAKDYLKKWTGYKDKENFCKDNLKMINRFKFKLSFDESKKDEETFYGKWQIDIDYTNDNNRESLWTMFGSGFNLGNEMILKEDNSYKYWIGIGYGGEGIFEKNKKTIDVHILKYYEIESDLGYDFKMYITKNKKNETMLVMKSFFKDYKYNIYWKKV